MTFTYRFPHDLMLNKTITWDTRKRYTAFLKELQELNFMRDSSSPALRNKVKPLDQEALRSASLIPYSTLFRAMGLKDRLQQQRGLFNDVAPEDDDSEGEFPPHPPAPYAARPSEDLTAFFALEDRCRRPSDHVKH